MGPLFLSRAGPHPTRPSWPPARAHRLGGPAAASLRPAWLHPRRSPSLSLAAHCPHLSAPFFFFPFFFLSFPFFTAGAFLSPVTTDGKPSTPSPAYGKRPIHRFPSLFPPPAGLYNPEPTPPSLPILCPLPRATAAGENPPPERERRRQGHPKHRRTSPRP